MNPLLHTESQDSSRALNTSSDTGIHPPFTSHCCWGLLAKDSVTSGFLNLFASIGGSGMLALPYAFKLSGVAMGTVVVVGAMGVNLLTCVLLYDFARKKALITLDHLFAATFQNQIHISFLSDSSNDFIYRLLHLFTGLNILLNNYGAIIVYIVVVTPLSRLKAWSPRQCIV